MKLYWAAHAWAIGEAYGYSLHNKKLRESVADVGVTITSDPNDDYDLAIHITTPDIFRPVSGRKNLLFTQIEMSEPFLWSETVQQAVALVTSCKHSRDVLSRYYIGPIEICPEGIDPLAFLYVERKAPSAGEPFRFLWHNLAIRAKGIDLVMAAWKAWGQSGRRPSNSELYVKDCGRADGTKAQLPAELPKKSEDFFSLPVIVRSALGLGYAAGTIIDTRNLSAAALTDLYRSAHAYVQASYGEGWGLTLTQAMASGLPCIWTHWNAPCDYADESMGFPVTDFEMEPFPCKPGANLPEASGARANPEAIIARMQEIVDDYPAALERGRRASERMHSRYTWAQAAERFIAICEQILARELPQPATSAVPA